jgi:hypothetical protein
VQTDRPQIPFVYTFRIIRVPLYTYIEYKYVYTCIEYKYVHTYIENPSTYI